MKKIEIVSIKQDFFDLCNFDNELLHNDNSKRPYLIILKLNYKAKKIQFALPFRSNINKFEPKINYYPLPTNTKTRDEHYHGLHFIKMFPVTNDFKLKFNITNNPYFNDVVYKKIEKDFKIIIAMAQNYLNEYEKGNKPLYCVNIDEIIKVLKN